MKTKFNEFLNENKQQNELPLPIKDEKYQFLRNLLDKCKYENTHHLPSKEPVEIGTCGEHKLYFNYLDTESYNDTLSFWFIYNNQQNDIYGNKWEFGVLYVENDKLISTDRHDEITLFPNYMELIYNEFKSYSDLDKWCETVKENGELGRKYHRWAIQKSRGITKEELTWEEKLEWKRSELFHSVYFNRYTKPTEQADLDEMLELGEEEFNRVTDERNKQIMDIFNGLDEEGAFDDEKNNEEDEN